MELSTTFFLLIQQTAPIFIFLMLWYQLDIDGATKILGIFTSLLFLVGFFVGIGYYFWKQKSYDTIVKEKAEIEQSLKLCREDKVELTTKIAKKLAENVELKRVNGELKRKRKLDRKLIHQQAGKIGGMELPEEHFFDHDDDDEYL